MKEHILRIKSQLNPISEDIKETQQLLRDASIQLVVRVFCKRETEFKGTNSTEFGTHGPEVHTDKYLAWNICDNRNKSDWYLLYEEEIIDGYIESDGVCLIDRTEGTPTVKLRKPLIETNSQVRVEMYEYIEKMLKEICNKSKLKLFKKTQEDLHASMASFPL